MNAVTKEQTIPRAGVSRVDSAYGWLLEEITSFRVRAGAPLSENKIAAQLGISRTPVREALQRLEKEGLVRRTDSARFSVSQITSSEVNDTCDLLEALDSYVFRKAASRLSEADAQALRESVAKMTAAAESGDRAQWAAADADFHSLLNGVAGNELIARTLTESRRRIQRFWLRAASMDHRLTTCSQEHRELADAIVAQDDAAIEHAVTVHIEHMRRSILDMIASAALLLGVE